MTVHFLKGASVRKVEEIQQQNNLGDDAGLKCFDIWNFEYYVLIFPTTLLFIFLMKSSGKHTRMIWLWKNTVEVYTSENTSFCNILSSAHTDYKTDQ